MKRIVLLFILVLTLSISVLAKDVTPEFDGVYLLTKSNKFIEIHGDRTDYYMSQIKRVDSYRSCTRDMRLFKIELNKLKYIVLKNQRYDADNFEKVIRGNKKGEFCESYAEKTLSVRSKSKGDVSFYQLSGVKKGDIISFSMSPYRYYIEIK